MTPKNKTYVQAIRKGLEEAGITAVIRDLPADPPSPKSGLTGAELSDYFCDPKSKASGKGGKRGS